MKKNYIVLLSLIALMIIFSLDAFAQKGKRAKDAPDFVCIHLGEKNPTFNEEAYPDLEFFYVPKIAITTDVSNEESAVGDAVLGVPEDMEAQGAPEFLVAWINSRIEGKKIGIKKLATVQRVQNIGITNHYGILFDLNDIAAWEGTIINRNVGMAEVEGLIRGSFGSIFGSKKEVILKESLNTIVKKGKTSKVAKEKTFEAGKENLVIGIKMPDFDVTNSAGETKSINSIISENKAPSLIMFFHIPSDVDMKAEEKAAKGEAPSQKAFLKTMVEAISVSGYAGIFEAIEEQFFGHARYPR